MAGAFWEPFTETTYLGDNTFVEETAPANVDVAVPATANVPVAMATLPTVAPHKGQALPSRRTRGS